MKKNKRYILSLEDNPNDILLMKRVIEKKILDYDAVFFSNMDESLAFLDQKSKEKHLPSIILLDIKLFKSSGLEVLYNLRKDQRFDKIPVVMLSSSDRKDDKQKAKLFGCNDYVEKPRSFMQLNNALPKIVSKWAINNYD